MAIKTEIVWHKASEELPKESGNYMVANVNEFGRPYNISNYDYSKIHKQFNCQDDMTPAEVETIAIPACYWAEKPLFPPKYYE